VTSFEDSVIAVISSLQPGDVTTYGEVAEEAG
jgi:alkylated DNA nucleotide flippase Atl1